MLHNADVKIKIQEQVFKETNSPVSIVQIEEQIDLFLKRKDSAWKWVDELGLSDQDQDWQIRYAIIKWSSDDLSPLPLASAPANKLIPPSSVKNFGRWRAGLHLFKSWPSSDDLKSRKRWSWPLTYLLFYGTSDGTTIRPIKNRYWRAKAINDWHSLNLRGLDVFDQKELFADVWKQCNWQKKKPSNGDSANDTRWWVARNKLLEALKTFESIPSRRQLSLASGCHRTTVSKHWDSLINPSTHDDDWDQEELDAYFAAEQAALKDEALPWPKLPKLSR